MRELVVPIGLAPTRSEEIAPKFRLMHECGQLVTQAKVCAEHGNVPDDQLVKVFEVAPGEYIPVDVEQLAAVAPPETRVVDLYAVVDESAVDPLLVKRSYLVVPGGAGAGKTGYRLVADALLAADAIALARFTLRSKERVARLASIDGTLLQLDELATDAELTDASTIVDAIGATLVEQRLVDLARKLVAKLEIPFDPALLTNKHTARVAALLEGKLNAGDVFHVDQAAPVTPVSDIAGALKASIAGVPRTMRARRDEALA